MNLIKKTILTAAVAAFATGSSAAILKYNGLSGSGIVSVDSNPTSGTLKYTGTAGGFKMEDTGNVLGLGTNFVAFCMDLAHFLNHSANYEITANPFPGNILTATQKANVEKLFDAAYSMVDVNNNTQAAAFQLALWEATYETDSMLSLTSGSRVGGSGTNAIKVLAGDYLTAANSWDGIDRYNVTYLDVTNEPSQDLVTATAVVPLPAAGLMLLGGLGALGAIRRRSRKKS